VMEFESASYWAVKSLGAAKSVSSSSAISSGTVPRTNNSVLVKAAGVDGLAKTMGFDPFKIFASSTELGCLKRAVSLFEDISLITLWKSILGTSRPLSYVLIGSFFL